MPAGRFRRQIAFLARHFRFIDTGEFRRWLEGEGVPRRAVLVTFDDGLLDLRDAALPILRESHVPALAFAVTGLIGRSNKWRTQPVTLSLQLLDADQLRALSSEDDVAIGAHRGPHRMLDRFVAESRSPTRSAARRPTSRHSRPSGHHSSPTRTVRTTSRRSGRRPLPALPGPSPPSRDSPDPAATRTRFREL